MLMEISELSQDSWNEIAPNCDNSSEHDLKKFTEYDVYVL